MKIKFDPEVDAAYISFKKGPTQVTTLGLSEDVAVDLGPHEEIVGIEILDASKYLGFDRSQPEVELENLKPVDSRVGFGICVTGSLYPRRIRGSFGFA